MPERLCTLGKVNVYRDGAAILFSAGMGVDADGSPRAYHPDDVSGLDALANAGHPGNWYGVVTVGGVPVIQSASDPAPGYYVSQTSLVDGNYPVRDPRRYVDAAKFPYVVVPGSLEVPRLAYGVRVGDVAAVIYGQRVAHAIIADSGPDGQCGEGSIRLADLLGINPDPRKGGVDTGVSYVLFPGSGTGKPMEWKEMDGLADTRFSAWGGTARLDAALGSQAV